MKKLMLVIALSMASALMAQDKSLSLADARGKIGDVVSNPETMTSLMKQLAASDQAAFLSSVNEAISKMPGSVDEKTAKYVAVDEAALKGAKNGNLTKLVAEVFATVPPESLTRVNERLAADLFNRASDPSKSYTDDQFTAISKKVFGAVQDRNATADGADVRDTFAILMLLRASNGTPADLRDTLVGEMKDENAKNMAQNEWITPALNGDYAPMLGASDAGEEPSAEVVMQLHRVDSIQAMFSDLASESNITLPGASFTAVMNPLYTDPNAVGLNRVPRTTDVDLPYNPQYRRGEPTEPRPYSGQSTGRIW